MRGLAGGAADKLGNRYENWYTALRIADLLAGSATRLRLEPPGNDGVGIEFEVDVGGTTWGEQTKDESASWTIRRLHSRNLLSAIRHQVELGRSYRLVSSSPAKALEVLSDRARRLPFRTFLNHLTQYQDDFDNISRFWNTTPIETWELLRKVDVEERSFKSLKREVAVAYQLHYAGDPQIIVGTVAAFCEENLHRSVPPVQGRW